jgi:tRNA threonylcarbamoyladenosine biosynthesis protein TsaB
MILFIDTTDSQKTSLSLKGKRLFRLVWNSKNNQEETIFRNLKKLMKKAKADFKELSKIAVVTGPGPFSRTRLGVVVANALALALDIKVVGINKLGVDTARLESETGERYVFPFYDREPNITIPKKKK